VDNESLRNAPELSLNLLPDCNVVAFLFRPTPTFELEMAHSVPIVGSIVERKSTSSISRPSTLTSSRTGFPAVQHRSKSAFARNREEKQSRQRVAPSSEISSLRDAPPVVHSLNDKSRFQPRNVAEPEDDWRDRISKENEERVAEMDDDERVEERRQVLERFGTNIRDVLKRARLAREQQKLSWNPPEPLFISQGFFDFLLRWTCSSDSYNAIDEIPISTEERKPVERGGFFFFVISWCI
jgi:hypothetical protein